MVTVVCTAMIYASLKPVAHWHSRFALPACLIFSVMTGATVLAALLAGFRLDPTRRGLAVGATLAAWVWKRLACGTTTSPDPGPTPTRNRAGGWHGVVLCCG